jgi:hypothetical protein
LTTFSGGSVLEPRNFDFAMFREPRDDKGWNDLAVGVVVLLAKVEFAVWKDEAESFFCDKFCGKDLKQTKQLK